MKPTLGIFQNRQQAGRELAEELTLYRDQENTIVLGIPRGGLPVAYEVASALHLPLDVYVVRKLGMPGHEEFAIGAIASGGVRVVNEEAIGHIFRSMDIITEVAEREQRELERREALYRRGRPLLDPKGKVVLVVDDGLATGSTMRAAVKALRQHGAARIVVAVPVAPPETSAILATEADEVICVLEPSNFMAVGQFYEDFSQTTDEEVSEILARAEEESGHRHE